MFTPATAATTARTTKAKLPILLSRAEIDALSDTAMRAYYKQRAHVDDARFFAERTLSAEAAQLAIDAELGRVSARETFVQLGRLQEADRVRELDTVWRRAPQQRTPTHEQVWTENSQVIQFFSRPL